MGRNAAFGRPPAIDRLRQWWYAKSRTSRTNLLVGLAVGVVVLVLMTAATSGDARRAKPPTFNAVRPPTTVGAPLSTVVVGDLRPAGTGGPTELSGSTTTSVITTTTAVPPTVTTTRAPARATTPPATVEPAPATTVPAPGVTVAGPTPAPTVVTTTSVVTAPPTTPPPTTIPTTTAPPAPTTSITSPPVLPRPGLPILLAPG